jgi:acetyltransferase-like isoleucine patch superfamily enzyme
MMSAKPVSLKFHFKAQIYFLLLFALNVWCSLNPAWILRRLVLSAVGCRLGSKAIIHRRVKLFYPGRLSVGHGSVINEGCYLDNRRGIEIGAHVSIAHDVKIYTLGHDIDSPNFAEKGAPVRIGDHAVIFANVLIMPGVRIGRGAVVLPGSVVSHDVPELAVVAGVPAKILRQRELNPAYTLSYFYWFAH